MRTVKVVGGDAVVSKLVGDPEAFFAQLRSETLKSAEEVTDRRIAHARRVFRAGK
jgi:hypothetical protein